MAEEDEDLITIVNVVDPNEPAFAHFKTTERPLTDEELGKLKPILKNAGAYKFFAMDFSFADAPAVKEFLDTVQLDAFRRTTDKFKIVQEDMKAVVAGREVVINADLIWRTFGLADDGLNISKPNKKASDLHTFYIKPVCTGRCQTKRGINLKHFKSEYSYFTNMAKQIQFYCCGLMGEGYINMSQYRAIDLMIRKKCVNWNRYILQNFQDRVRKYRLTPCDLYFGGSLTALIYKALGVDYETVKMKAAPSLQALKAENTPRKWSSRKKSLETEEEPAARSETEAADGGRKRKAAVDAAVVIAKRRKSSKGEGKARKRSDAKRVLLSNMRKKKKKRPQPPRRVTMGKFELITRFSHRGSDLSEDMGSKLTKMYYEAAGIKPRRSADVSYSGPLEISSTGLWERFEEFHKLEEELMLEHWFAKKALEESLVKLQELEAAVQAKDEELEEKAPLTRIEQLEEALKAKSERVVEMAAEIDLLQGKHADEEVVSQLMELAMFVANK